jgi:hypothetical protein
MIDLPDWPGPREAVPFVQDFGGTLTPSVGAQTQRLNRLGTRYGLRVTMPPLESRREGRVWVNRLVRGMQEGARMEYPLLDFNPGSPGSFVVDGAGQAGTSLVISGGTPNYAFREGQPFSLEVGGQHYLDFIAEPSLADASGAATITLTQMLRVSPADGDALHFGKPMVEGLVVGDEVTWHLALDRFIGIEFALAESA